MKEQVIQKKNSYEILQIFEETLDKLPEEEKDRYIEERKKGLLSMCQRDLEKANSYKDKLKIETTIKEIEEAYETIKTKERREVYTKNHSKEYNLCLINDLSNSKHRSLQTKNVRRKPVCLGEKAYSDKENRQLRVKKTGELEFQNWTGVGQLFVSELEVKRIIKGQEKVNTVYTSSSSASINEKTGEPVDPDYYDCFINKLLAETTIEASNSMGGFIGGIERNQAGKYYITLEDKELSPMEKEQLAAVMTWQQIVKQKEKSHEREVM